MLIFLCLTISFMSVLVNADFDAEDLIAKGYTCSLAAKNAEFITADVGTVIVYEDGVAIECFLTGKRAEPLLQGSDDVEDYLKAGYICTPDSATTPRPGIVCDDGYCFSCKKPVWLEKRGDVEDYLENGYSCFLVSDVPKDALKDNVVVICDDGDCFGCIEQYNDREHEHRSSQTIANAKTGNVEEYAVTKRFLDEAEDLLEGGYRCDLTNHPIKPSSYKDRFPCTGKLCLVCGVGVMSRSRIKGVVALSQLVLESVEDLVDIGFRCFAVLEKVEVRNDVETKTVCDAEMCFVCRK